MVIIQVGFLLILCYLIIQIVSLGCVAIAHNNKRRHKDEVLVRDLPDTEYRAVEGVAYRNECR